MIAYHKWSRWYEDNLILRVIPKVEHCSKLTMFSQRKRLPASTSDFDREVQKHYRRSTVHAIKFIKTEKNLRIFEALEYLNKLRYNKGQLVCNCWRRFK